MKVIPEPKEVTFEGRPSRLGEMEAISANPSDRLAAQILQEAIGAHGFEVPIVSALPSGRAVVVGVPERDPLVAEMCSKYGVEVPDGPESYTLWIDEDVVLVASKGPAGVFYGVQTLVQLIESLNGELPGLRVRDWPDMCYRGLQVDISRGPVLRMDYLKKLIRTMAKFKLNMLTLYTEHMFRFEKHPVIGPEGAALTAEEVRELSSYARKYYVELVGNFQSLGHFRNILKHREYRDLAETPFRWVISPAKKGTYGLLEELYSELVAPYESELFNVNCDETWGLGEGASRERAEEIGVEGVYLEHLLKLRKMLARRGKRMMFWGDVLLNHPQVIPKVPKDAIVLNWTYLAKESYRDRVDTFSKAGLKQLVCPGVSCWNRIFPDYVNAVPNIQNFVRDGYRGGALGMLNTTWNDDGENLFGYNWYGILWGAECAWGPERADQEAFDRKFPACFYGADVPEVVQAIKLLGSCEQVIWPRCAPGIGTDALFWEDPFSGESPKEIEGFWDKMKEVGRRAKEAKDLLERAVPRIVRERENFDYLLFASERMSLLARKFLEVRDILSEYESLSEQPSKTVPKLKAMGWRLAELRAQVEDLEDKYRRLWLRECRPYWLEVNLVKYDELIKLLEKRARRLLRMAEECFEGRPLPPVEDWISVRHG